MSAHDRTNYCHKQGVAMPLEKLEESVYRAIKQPSQTDCKNILSMSGHEYQELKNNPTEPTPAMLRGTLAHAIALEGTDLAFSSNYAIDRYPSEFPDKKRNAGKEYQAYKKKLLESGKPYIKEEDIATVEGIAKAAERDFGKILKDGSPEISLHGSEIVPGIKAKGMIDFLPEHNFIFDFKTTSKSLDDFQMNRFLYRDEWRIQAAFYHDLLEIETGESRPFVFLIVNEKPPFATRKMVVEPQSKCMQSGRERYIEALELYKQYTAIEGRWPGYPMYKVLKKEEERENR